MRKILTLLPTQVSFWHFVYQLSTGTLLLIVLAAIPFVIFATITGLSWWKGLKSLHFKRIAKRHELLQQGVPIPVYLRSVAFWKGEEAGWPPR